MKIYKIVTYDDNTIEINERHFEWLQENPTEKFIKIGDLILAINSIKEVYLDHAETNKRKVEALELNEFFGGDIVGFLSSGKVDKDSTNKRKLRLLHQAYFEHVRRRPLLVKEQQAMLDQNFKGQDRQAVRLTDLDIKIIAMKDLDEYLTWKGKPDLINL